MASRPVVSVTSSRRRPYKTPSMMDTFNALAPYTADSVYVNYLADDDTARVQAAYGPCWDRLRVRQR
jgi:hypothetical protein